MKKSELKTGMLVKHVYHTDLGIIMLNTDEGDLIVYKNGQNDLDDWKEDLTYADDSEWNIEEVWNAIDSKYFTSYSLDNRKLIYKAINHSIELTDDYHADFNIEDKTITVGCQTIPFSKVIEVANKIQELNTPKKPTRKPIKKR